VDSLFYDKIYNILMGGKEEINRLNAFEVISNMIQSDKQRHALAKDDYLKALFEKMLEIVEKEEAELNPTDLRTLEKLSWLITLISYHEDMFDHIINLGVLKLVISLSDNKFPPVVRSNAVLAISLLTYNDKLFDEIIDKKVIELIMKICNED